MTEQPTLRILAAEDNPTNRMVLKLMLEQADLTADFVENGAEAVEAWQRQSYDLILMDMQMPVMSGPDATREIRRLEQACGRARVSIIAVSANAMAQHVAECMDSGMDDHVAKPLDPNTLFAAILRHVETSD